MFQIWYETDVVGAVFSTKEKAVEYLNAQAEDYGDAKYRLGASDHLINEVTGLTVDYPDIRELKLDPVYDPAADHDWKHPNYIRVFDR